jgi:cytochrome c553
VKAWHSLALFALALLVPGFAAARSPDLDHGRDMALKGSPGGAQACAACHKLDGTGDSSGAFPRLTGQAGFYLYKQLKDYAAGRRDSQVMAPVAQRLTDEEMQDLAGYFASVSGPFTPPQIGNSQPIQRGGVLSAIGSAKENIPACVNCHGQSGAGMPPSFPYLAGQYARYLRDQLAAWKDGSRRNDPMNVMRDIAARLGAEDVAALGEYFAHVYPPAR